MHIKNNIYKNVEIDSQLFEVHANVIYLDGNVTVNVTKVIDKYGENFNCFKEIAEQIILDMEEIF